VDVHNYMTIEFPLISMAWHDRFLILASA